MSLTVIANSNLSQHSASLKKLLSRDYAAHVVLALTVTYYT